MVSLQVLKGANEGSLIPLDGKRMVLGRNPECDICIPNHSVSREHAEITHVAGKFYLKDLESRNQTFLNNEPIPITSRIVLKNNDKIRICEFVVAFIDQESAVHRTEESEEENEELENSSTVQATLSQGNNLILEDQPAEKLRHLLEISTNLNKTLDLGPLLNKIVDSMFQLFRQADRVFLIQAEETGKDDQYRLMPRVIKTRRAVNEANASYSKSYIRNCMQTAKAFLLDDAQRPGPMQLSQSVVISRIRSVMCAPLCGANGKPFGVIQIDTQDPIKKFTQDDLKLLLGVANQAAVAMDNARMLEESVKTERYRRELQLAKEVQYSFLPKTLPTVPSYQFAAHYKPAQAVGGDYYGFIPMSDGRLAVAVGDVAGKGVPASLLMAKLSSDSRFCFSTEGRIGVAVAKLNDLLYEITSAGDRFVTFAVLILDPTHHVVTMVSAGHASPLLYRPGCQQLEEVITKAVVGYPLGIMEGVEFESCQLELKPGESLLIFTDGVNDALDQQNVQFGVDGIQKALHNMGNASPVNLVEKLAGAVETHATGRDPFDDVTLVGLGRVS